MSDHPTKTCTFDLLTPPSKLDPRKNLRPDQFLTDPTTMQSIFKKSDLILNKESAKRFVLTPPVLDQDHSISQYHSRVEGEYITAKTDFNPIVTGIKVNSF